MENDHLPGLDSDTLTTIASRKFQRQSGFFRLLLAVTTATCILLPLCKITVYSTIPGQLMHSRDPIQLKAPVGGYVSYVRPSHDAPVKPGDTLLILSHPHYKFRFEEIMDKMELLQQEKKAWQELNRASTVMDSMPPTVRNNWNTYQEELRSHTNDVNTAKSKFHMMETLYSRAVISKAERDEYKFNYHQSRTNLNLLRNQFAERWAQHAKRIQEELESLKIQLTTIEEEIEKHFILAPCSGMVEGFDLLQPGQFIEPRYQLGRIIPDDGTDIQLYLTPRELSHLQLGEIVYLRFPGKVPGNWNFVKTSLYLEKRHLVEEENGLYYEVRASIINDTLTTIQGETFPTLAGLSLEVQYQLEHLRLYELILKSTVRNNYRVAFQRPTM